jgi:uncharacterized phage protein gp47/JayE
MALKPPILDDRTLARVVRQLLAEAKIAFANSSPPLPRLWKYAEQFTEQQIREFLAKPFDDAGLMLSVVYARLMELSIERLNRVPEKNFLAFLDTMGVSPMPPSPARVPLIFALSPGAGPTLVPRGTQAAAQPGNVVFENEDDVTVIPARIATAFTMDPTFDRFTDQSEEIGGASEFGFTPFVGSKRAPHVLNLGEDALLDFKSAVVDLYLNPFPFGSGSSPSWAAVLATLRPILSRLAWQQIRGNLAVPLARLGTHSIADPLPFPRKTSGPLLAGAASMTLDEVTGIAANDAIQMGTGITSELVRVTSVDAVSNTVHFAPALGSDHGDDFRLLPPTVITTRLAASTSPPSVTQIFVESVSGIMPDDWIAIVKADNNSETVEVSRIISVTGTRRLNLDSSLPLIRPFPLGASVSILRPPALRFVNPGGADRTTIRGVSESTEIQQGIESRWLQALTTSFLLDDSGARALSINNVKLRVTAAGLQPDLAFGNTAPLDVTKDFLPFGDTPKVGDTFYIANREALSKPGVSVWMQVDLKPPPPPPLIWEYWNGHIWAKLGGVTTVIECDAPTLVTASFPGDGTNGFTKSGKISLARPSDMALTTVNGEEGVWFRVKIASGAYSSAPKVAKFDLETSRTVMAAAYNPPGGTDNDRFNFLFSIPVFQIIGSLGEVQRYTLVDAGAVLRIGSLDPVKDDALEYALIVGAFLPIELPLPRAGDPLTSSVRATSVIGRGSQDNVLLEPIPTLIQAHRSGGPVEHQGLSPVIGAIVRVATQAGIVASLLPQPICVSVTREIKPGDVLMIDDPAPREFVVVSEATFGCPVSSDTAPRVVIGGQPPPTVPAIDFGLIHFLRFPFEQSLVPKSALRFPHNAGTPVRLVTDYFVGYADDKRVVFNNVSAANSFFPFGEQAGAEDAFYFGTSTVFPGYINIAVEVVPTVPNVEVNWDFLGQNGWQSFDKVIDRTINLTRPGLVSFSPQTYDEGEVNGQSNYWTRARIKCGDYGRPVAFVMADPADPKQGFKVRSGTGNLNPPLITRLTLNYEARGEPIVVTRNGFLFTDRTKANKSGANFPTFQAITELSPDIYADPEPAFYLGFDNAFPEEPVSLYVSEKPAAASGNVAGNGGAQPSAAQPPGRDLVWEYFDGTNWKRLVVIDGTNNLTESGPVEFLTPPDIQPLAKFDLTPRFWLRARSSDNDPFDTQHLLGVFANATRAIQTVTSTEDPLGSGNGEPSQQLRFGKTPVQAGRQVFVRENETPSGRELAELIEAEGEDALQQRTNAATQEPETWVRWHEVPNFLASGPASRHYAADGVTGAITFGDGKHGQTLPRGTNNVTATYRAGGGANGNVARAAIAKLKSGVVGVTGVTNPIAADGGAEAETLEMVKDRGPQSLRHRDRAMSRSDFEWLAREAAGTRVARVKCLPNRNRQLQFERGWVSLIIVPDDPSPKPSPSAELIAEVENYLEKRAFAGLTGSSTRINVTGPGYLRVTVHAEVVPADISQADPVKKRVIAALDRFLHPLKGGPEGRGWEFGRDVHQSEVCQLIEGVPGVSHARNVELEANTAQHNFMFSTAVGAIPEGAEVILGTPAPEPTPRKKVVVAEPTRVEGPLTLLPVTEFKEGDRITAILDGKVAGLPSSGPFSTFSISALDGSTIPNQFFRFPAGTLIVNRRTGKHWRLADRDHLTSSFVRSATSIISIDKSIDNSDVAVGDILTLLNPFPMIVTSVDARLVTIPAFAIGPPALNVNVIPVMPFSSGPLGIPKGALITLAVLIVGGKTFPIGALKAAIRPNQENITLIEFEATQAGEVSPGLPGGILFAVQTVGVEPYETDVAIERGDILGTLDGRVRLPSMLSVAESARVTALVLEAALPGETARITLPGSQSAAVAEPIVAIEPLNTTVFVDRNSLVYSGAHRINIVAR